MVERKAVQAWELAYRRYGEASAQVDRAGLVDAVTAEWMAHASLAVAVSWRAISDTTLMPWWLVAALDSAAQAYESQSDYWKKRAAVAGGEFHGSV